MEETAAARPGFFGKLPARGDFVERRLDRAFCRGLDAWLGASMAGAKALLGDAFLPAYLEAPLWRFVIGAGVCGPRACGGVMMPSVDRVGRYFPLLIGSHAVTDEPAGPESAWFDSAERCLLTALEDDCSFEAFDASVAGLDDRLPGGGPAAFAEGSVWWTLGSEAVAPLALVCRQLPPEAGFPAFLNGNPRAGVWTPANETIFGMQAFGAAEASKKEGLLF